MISRALCASGLATLIVLLGAAFAGADTASFDWASWDGILKQRVKPARIDGIALQGFDYDGLAKDRSAFDRLLTSLSTYTPRIESPKEKLAFWINVYNVGAVKMVLDHPGIGSLNEVGNKPGSVWKMDALVVGGKSYSLDAIEHQILRKLKEPRIHFAVVCASVSCPDIRAEAYHKDGLDRQLNDQVGRFLANSRKGLHIDTAGKRLVVTKLFEWFGGDFGGPEGLKKFIARHLPKNTLAPAGWPEFTVGYFDYSWKLNRFPAP